jgi:hypothetical protein
MTDEQLLAFEKADRRFLQAQTEENRRALELLVKSCDHRYPTGESAYTSGVNVTYCSICGKAKT